MRMAMSIMVFGLCLCTPALFAENDAELGARPTRSEHRDLR